MTLGADCAAAFPDLRPTAAWQMGSDDALKLVDDKGAVLLELTEVEAGMYETTPSYTRYFLQTLAAVGKERIADDLFGDWQFTRGPGTPYASSRSATPRTTPTASCSRSSPAAIRSSRALRRSPGSSTAASS